MIARELASYRRLLYHDYEKDRCCDKAEVIWEISCRLRSCLFSPGMRHLTGVPSLE